MRYTVIQIVLCGLVLGIMCGAALVHHVHLSGAREMSEAGMWPGGEGNGDGEAALFITPASAQGGRDAGEAGTKPESAEVSQATVAALGEIVERLQELKSENVGLTRQVEEINRDFMELQFRVDTHSDSFRPMRGSLDVIDSHLLLPPKAP